MALLDNDKEQAEIFLKGIEAVSDMQTVWRMWDMMRHRFPFYQLKGLELLDKRSTPVAIPYSLWEEKE